METRTDDIGEGDILPAAWEGIWMDRRHTVSESSAHDNGDVWGDLTEEDELWYSDPAYHADPPPLHPWWHRLFQKLTTT